MLIADFDAARRIGFRFVEQNPDALGYRVFQYEQPGSRLTLFGVAVQFGEGREVEIRTQPTGDTA